jgi:cell wall-associated NlpC family hydrolase
MGHMSIRGPLLIAALAFLAQACASTGAVPRPFPVPGGASPRSQPPGAERPADTPAVGADGYAVTVTALSLRGAPYRNGGSDPSGFDCSGFVWYVLRQHGIHIPRTVGEQYRQGLDVSRDTLEAGDLVFFSTEARGPSHVGMIIGGDEFVHAPSARGDVRVERISSSYWAARYVGAKRVR